MRELTDEQCDIIMSSPCWNCNRSTVAVSDRGAYVCYCYNEAIFYLDEDIIKGDKVPGCFELDSDDEKNAIIDEYLALKNKAEERKRKAVINDLVMDYEQDYFYLDNFYKTLNVVIELYGNKIQDKHYLMRKLNSTIVFFSEEEVKEYILRDGYVEKTTFETMIEWIPDKDKLKFYEKEFNIFKSEKEKVYYQKI